jgi:hypothetical protein
MGGRTNLGLAVEMPGAFDSLRQERLQLPWVDPTRVCLTMVSSYLSTTGRLDVLRYFLTPRRIQFRHWETISYRIGRSKNPGKLPLCEYAGGTRYRMDSTEVR